MDVGGCLALVVDCEGGGPFQFFPFYLWLPCRMSHNTSLMAANGGQGPKEIYALIESHLPSKDKEKSALGEVFTPISMIDDLYDQFPPRIWQDSTSTWLDPSAGIGNFPIVLFFRFMKGLRSKIPNATRRAEHILHKMLYMVEINKENVRICKQIFKKLCPTATPNIFQGDFTTLTSRKLGWPSSFDCMVGNPPYNIGGTGLEGSKRTHILFTELGLQLLTPRGYLAYICPPSYRETGTPMNQLFQDANGHFVSIKIYGAKETFQLFRIQGRVDAFVYQKGVKGRTVLDDEYRVVTQNVALDLRQHIPNFGYTIFQKLFSHVRTLGHVEAFRNTEMSSVKANTFGCHGKHKVLHLITAKGRRVFRTVKEHSLASVPKLLVNGLGVPYVFYDRHGAYGPSQSPVVILRPNKNLVDFLQSDMFAFLAWGMRFTGNNNLPYLFDAVPNLPSTGSYHTMKAIQDAFRLTKAEVDFITEHFHSYTYDDVDIIEKCVKGDTKKKKKT